MLTINARKFFMVQLPWLLAILMMNCIIAIVFLGRLFWYPVFTLGLHDTYYVIWWTYSFLPLCLLLFFLVLLVTESSRGYRRVLANFLLVITGILLIVFLYLFQKTLLPQGFTMYPALSALDVSPEAKLWSLKTLWFVFPSLQIILTIAVIYVAWRWKLSRTPGNT